MSVNGYLIILWVLLSKKGSGYNEIRQGYFPMLQGQVAGYKSYESIALKSPCFGVETPEGCISFP